MPGPKECGPFGAWVPIADTGTGTTHPFRIPIAGNAQIFMRLRVSTP